MAPEQRFMAIGRVVAPHGVRGEVKVLVLTDFPSRFRAGTVLFLGVERAASPVEIEAVRPHGSALLVKLKGVEDRDAAEALRERYFLIRDEEAMPLGEHENYVHDLIGLAVETPEGEPLGTIVEILFNRANDVYVVDGPGGELLLPALRSVVLRVDLEAGKMIVRVPEGLRD